MSKKKPIRKKRAKKKKVWSAEKLLKQAIQRIWFFSPLRHSIAKRARESLVKGISTWRCEKCRKLTEKINIDHINPVVDPEVGFVDWNTFVARTFPDPSNLQALCISCHQIKSEKENKVRRAKKAVDKLTK